MRISCGRCPCGGDIGEEVRVLNIIETVRNILESFPKISEVCNEIHIDFADPEPTSYGLTSTGDSLIKEDILGNQTRQHTFMLYSTFSGINDYERLVNSSALTELSQWLSTKRGNTVLSEIGEDIHTGELLSIKAENGMLFDVPQGNETDGIMYRTNLVAEYTIEF